VLYKHLHITFHVVNDGLPARIRALRSKDQGWQTVAEWCVGIKRSGMT